MKDAQTGRLTRWFKGMMLKHVHSMITCKEFENFIQAYIDDELPKSQLRIFKLHLRACRECRDYLAAYERSMELGRMVIGASADPVPGSVPEDLIKAVLSARKQ